MVVFTICPIKIRFDFSQTFTLFRNQAFNYAKNGPEILKYFHLLYFLVTRIAHCCKELNFFFVHINKVYSLKTQKLLITTLSSIYVSLGEKILSKNAIDHLDNQNVLIESLTSIYIYLAEKRGTP